MATVPAPLRQGPARPGVPNAVLGMALFLATEVMFFAGLISAFLVVKARWTAAWPPPGQPRLPVVETAWNTGILLASGVVLWHTARAYAGGLALPRVRWRSLLAAALGSAFVVLQGREWARLLAFGLTMRSGPYGSFFYLIVGTHALHAVAAVVALCVASWQLPRGGIGPEGYRAVRMFWYFVVGLWPILYVLVYLAP